MSFEKMKPIKGGHGGCMSCGYQYDILPMGSIIAVGLGFAGVTKNDEQIYIEPNEYDEEDEGEKQYWTVQDAENVAKQDPDNDWRIHLVAPLSERHYQRQGDNNWVLYEKGMGFA